FTQLRPRGRGKPASPTSRPASITPENLGFCMKGLPARHMRAALGGAAVLTIYSVQGLSAQEAQNQAQPTGTTLLDRITVVSRTDETPIETMASISHIGEERLEQRLATTPNDLLFGIPGVSIYADARPSAGSRWAAAGTGRRSRLWPPSAILERGVWSSVWQPRHTTACSAFRASASIPTGGRPSAMSTFAGFKMPAAFP